MKILHTADWHLGKKLDNYSRLEEQKQVMAEICDIAEAHAVDCVLIAGDLYDTYAPSNEASSLFYKTLRRLSNNGKRAVVAIAGNHDSPDRIEAPEPLALEMGIFLIGYPNSQVPEAQYGEHIEVSRSAPGFMELSLPDCPPLRLILTPYANELRLKTYLKSEDREDELRQIIAQQWQKIAEKYCDDKGVNCLMAHLFFMTRDKEAPKENLDEERSILHVGGAQAIFADQVPPQIHYTALGHLHRYQTLAGAAAPVVYSGSPLAYSFSERDQQKYVLLLNAEAGQTPSLEPIALKSGKRLLRERFEDIGSAEEWLKANQEALVEIMIRTEHYLTAAERQRLNAIHPNIKAIIPDLRSQTASFDVANIDLNKDVEALFSDYFRETYQGQNPDDSLLALLREVMSTDNEDSEND